MIATKKTDRETTVTSILQDIAEASARERARILDGLRTYVRAGKDGEAAVQSLFAETAETLGCTVEASSYNPADVRMIEDSPARPPSIRRPAPASSRAAREPETGAA